MDKELHRTLGLAKAKELSRKSATLWNILQLSETRKSAQVGGMVLEGICRDFIREFLPAGLGLKSGLVFDAEGERMSPQIDAIIYKGVPLLEYTDVAVVEKEQVKAIFEIKSYVVQTAIFGELVEKGAKDRDSTTGLAYEFERRSNFLPAGARAILFTFELHSASTDEEVCKRLREICDAYAVVLRREPVVERKRGKESWVYNFDNSVSQLIEWLRNLS